MNNKSKKIIVITIIILIIVIIGVLILTRNVNNKLMPDEVEIIGEVIVNKKLERVNTRGNYYVVKNIVEKYYSSLCDLNKTSDDVLIFEYDEETEKLEQEIANEIENGKKRIYNFFDKKYVEETGLTVDNLQNKLGDYNDLYVLVKDMYVRDLSGYLRVYFAFGTLTEKQTLKSEEFKLMVVTDEKNKTFDIYTSDYIDKNDLYELSKKDDFSEKIFNINQVENRTYNKYQYKTINDETYARDLLKNYTQAIKYSENEFVYDRIDEEYKNKKFNVKSDYEEYIEDNKKSITTATLKYYKVDKYEGYKQYLCVDQAGKYYIFKEKEPMNYKLILDTYTVDLPEFIEKYNMATTEEKVVLNIQKMVEALNERDYNYIYSVLADEFKANYFKTYEEFEKYAENTFDIENEVTYNNYTESEELCTYKITLNGKNKTITKTIVMRLDEGTNFVMSFNVN